MSELAKHIRMLQPPPSLLEFLSDDRHEFDAITIRQLLADPEVSDWMTRMGKAVMLPVKRNNPKPTKAKARRV